MAAAASSTVWDTKPCAGAAEPGAGGLSKTEDDETVLRVAYYNVGMLQTALDSKYSARSKKNVAEIWQVTLLNHSGSIVCIFFACASWENMGLAFKEKKPRLRVTRGLAAADRKHGQ